MATYTTLAVSDPFKKTYTYPGAGGFPNGDVRGIHQGAAGTWQFSTHSPGSGAREVGSGSLEITHKPDAAAPITADGYKWKGKDLGIQLFGDAGIPLDELFDLTQVTTGIGPLGGSDIGYLTNTPQTTVKNYRVTLSASGFVAGTLLCLTFKDDTGVAGVQGVADGDGHFEVDIYYAVGA